MCNKSQANRKDYYSVYYGRVHNIGAGGVSLKGDIDYRPLPYFSKRLRQWFRRTERAVGFVDID